MQENYCLIAKGNEEYP